jgi:hypothetical protein
MLRSLLELLRHPSNCFEVAGTSNAMPRYLISFDDGSIHPIAEEDWPAVGESAHAVVREDKLQEP